MSNRRPQRVVVGLLAAVLALWLARHALGPPSPQAPGHDGSPAVRPAGNVLLIGWDGTRRGRVKQLLADGRLPNLQALAREGRLIDFAVKTGETQTKPGWAEILTGYSPDVTGVRDNRRDYKPISVSYTVFERLQSRLGDQGFKTVFLAGKWQNLGTRGPHKVWPNGPRTRWFDERCWKKEEIVGQEILTLPGEPYRWTRDHVDIFQNGLRSADKVGPAVLASLERVKDHPFMLFVQFEEPDEQGHVYGEASPEYSAALQTDDAWLGRIRAKLQALGIADRTTIYVVSDHGFNEGQQGHRDAADTFMATNDREVTRQEGERKDIAPTIYRHYGLDVSSFQPPLEGRPLQ